MVLNPHFLLRLFRFCEPVFQEKLLRSFSPGIFFPDPFSKNTLTSIVSTLAQRCHCEKVDAKMATASTNCCCSGSSNSWKDRSTINPWKDVPRFSPNWRCTVLQPIQRPTTKKKIYIYIYIFHATCLSSIFQQKVTHHRNESHVSAGKIWNCHDWPESITPLPSLPQFAGRHLSIPDPSGSTANISKKKKLWKNGGRKMQKMGTFPGFCWVCLFLLRLFCPSTTTSSCSFFGAGWYKTFLRKWKPKHPDISNASQNTWISHDWKIRVI